MVCGTRPPRSLVAIVTLILLSATAPSFADYRSDYADGLEAVQRQDWPEVERLMRAAAASKGSEGRVRIYGMRFDPYLPYYYLGVALFEQGDCAGALDAWQTSESQGFITKQDQYADLQERRQSCRQRIARVAPTPELAPTATALPDVTAAVRSARSRIQAVEEAAAGIASLRSDSNYRAAWNADPNLARRSDQAGNTLRSARTRLEAGERSASEDEIAGAVELADRAAQDYAAIRSDLDQLRQRMALDADQRRDQQAVLRQARGEVATSAAAAREVLNRPDAAGIASEPGRTQRSQLEELLRQADGAATISSAARLRELAQGIGSRTVAFERSLVAAASRVPSEPTPGLPSAPPQQLRIAAETFFGGDYQKTLSLLEGANFEDPRAIAASHLLRAGASFSLFLAGGEQDEDLQRTALAELRRCRAIRRQITLDPALFSPRFAELVSSLR
jgi:hypothetical protein